MLHSGLALEILQLDAQLRMGTGGIIAETTDIALALENLEHVCTQLAGGGQDGVLLRLLAVADAGEHITQGIGHSHAS